MDAVGSAKNHQFMQKRNRFLDRQFGQLSEKLDRERKATIHRVTLKREKIQKEMLNIQAATLPINKSLLPDISQNSRHAPNRVSRRPDHRARNSPPSGLFLEIIPRSGALNSTKRELLKISHVRLPSIEWNDQLLNDTNPLGPEPSGSAPHSAAKANHTLDEPTHSPSQTILSLTERAATITEPARSLTTPAIDHNHLQLAAARLRDFEATILHRDYQKATRGLAQRFCAITNSLNDKVYKRLSSDRMKKTSSPTAAQREALLNARVVLRGTKYEHMDVFGITD